MGSDKGEWYGDERSNGKVHGQWRQVHMSSIQLFNGQLSQGQGAAAGNAID